MIWTDSLVQALTAWHKLHQSLSPDHPGTGPDSPVQTGICLVCDSLQLLAEKYRS